MYTLPIMPYLIDRHTRVDGGALRQSLDCNREVT